MSGTYTAIAEETSSLGNAIGKSESRTFVVNTEPPEVTLSDGAIAVERHDSVVQRDGERIAAA